MKIARAYFADPVCRPGTMTQPEATWLTAKDGVTLEWKDDARLYITKDGNTVVVPDSNIVCVIPEATPAKGKP